MKERFIRYLLPFIIRNENNNCFLKFQTGKSWMKTMMIERGNIARKWKTLKSARIHATIILLLMYSCRQNHSYIPTVTKLFSNCDANDMHTAREASANQKSSLKTSLAFVDCTMYSAYLFRFASISTTFFFCSKNVQGWCMSLTTWTCNQSASKRLRT